MKKYRDIISGAVLFVLAAAYYVMAMGIKQYNAGQKGIITSDFMPKIYGAAVMVLSAILIIRAVIKLKKGQAEQGESSSGQKMSFQPEIPLVFLLLIVYVLLLPTVGFVIMSILFILGLSYILLPREQRGPKTYLIILAVAVLFTVSITLIFIQGFNLTLPMGILG